MDGQLVIGGHFWEVANEADQSNDRLAGTGERN